MVRQLGLAVAVLMVALGVARGDGRRGFHQKAYVVPAPGKVAIDGKLDEWDLSAQILISVADETAEMQSARFAMMYDAEALYVGAVVRDPTPLLNRHDPKIDPSRAWDADVCQIYLTTDTALGYPLNGDGGKDVPGTMDLYLWQFTDRQETALSCYRGMKWAPLHADWDATGAIPADRFQGSYVKAADGRGYTMEYRIPWETLGAQRPLKAGDLVAGLVQFNWSDTTGLTTGGNAAWAYDVMGRPGFPWQDNSCWGKIIFSDKGNLPQDLVEEGLPPAKPLPLTYAFDLPREAEATIQFFDEKGYLARTLVASAARRAGRNVERWDGLDATGKPLAPGKYVWKGLYHGPITTKYLFSAHNSGQPAYHTDNGKGAWGGDHGNPAAACALPDGMILTWDVSEAGFGIIKTDFEGRKQWGSKHNAASVATDGERLFVVGDCTHEASNGAKVFDARDCRPLNWGNGKLSLDPPAGGTDADNIATGIAYGQGRVYVSWTKRNAIGVYDAKSGDLKETWEVTAPGRLAARPAGGVVVISEGKVRAIGPQGSSVVIADHLDLEPNVAQFDHGVLQVPNGIAVGPDGTIYVANSGRLQCVTVFDANGKYRRTVGRKGGRPARGRYDRNGIYQPGGIALDKNGRLWVAERTDFPKRISVWDAGSGKFVNEFFGAAAYYGWAYMDPRRPDELYCQNVVWKVDWKKNTCTPVSTMWRPTAPNEIANVNPDGYVGQLRVYTLKNGRQIARGGGHFQHILMQRTGDLFKPFAITFEIRRSGQWPTGDQYPIFTDSKRWPDGRYYWWDANDDQTIQENEVTQDDKRWKQYLFDLRRQLKSPEDVEAETIGFSKHGEWDLARFDGPAQELGAKPVWAYRGGVYWWTAINFPPQRAGDMFGLTVQLGVAGQFTGGASYFGVFEIVTTDGVYVAQGFRDTRAGGSLGADTLCSETNSGQLVKPAGMNRYFFLGGATDGRVTEVLGLDTVQRLPGGEFVFSEDDARLAATALADYKARLARSQRLTIVRGRKALETARGVGKALDTARSFTARAAYDGENLYLQYDVTSPNELTNEIADPMFLFKGGNALDFQIASDAAADPQRKMPATGDVRLLVTRQNGKPVAMLYRPKVQGFPGQPIVFKSASGQEPFDAIERLDVGLDYRKVSGGFRAVVTVPLKLLNWAPRIGESVRLDVGYLFGNATGNDVSVRAYWSNGGFAAGVVHDVPNESRLVPGEWGTATVE